MLLQVIELAGLAPAPVCGMILSDFGAKVTRVDKVDQFCTMCTMYHLFRWGRG